MKFHLWIFALCTCRIGGPHGGKARFEGVRILQTGFEAQDNPSVLHVKEGGSVELMNCWITSERGCGVLIQVYKP